jgi:uncharacterized phiE125 gp8 family phage protein
MRTRINTHPALEPVTVAEAKLHAKVEIDDDDAMISAYIVAARTMAEAYTDRVFIEQTWDGWLDRFPSCWDADGAEIVIPQCPLIAVTTLEYRAPDASAYTPLAEGTDFEIVPGSEPGKLALMPGKSWPAISERLGSVHLQYSAGYGPAADDVPEAIRVAILTLVADMYDNRSPVPTTFAEQQMRQKLGPFALGRLY